LVVIHKAKINSPVFLVKIRGKLKKGDISSAIEYCLEDKSPAANVVRKGLKKYKYGSEKMHDAAESAIKQEIPKLDSGLYIISTITIVAPLLGILGSVVNIMDFFWKLSLQKTNIGISLAGYAEVLLPLAFGILVGIIAHIFINYINNLIKQLVLEIQNISSDVLDIWDEANIKNAEQLEIEFK
ncbi:MAG: MotA/TolQ/ExbB proton channel family protein, partial [Methanococcaceae archaeon]